MLVRERERKDTESWSNHREGGWGGRYLVRDGTDFDGDVLLPGFSQDRRVLAQSKPMADPGRVQITASRRFLSTEVPSQSGNREGSSVGWIGPQTFGR